MNEQTILDNKRGRETAQEIAQLARLETIPMSAAARARFWEQLQFEVAKELPQAQTPPLMSAAQIAAFGASLVPYGSHRGERVDDVPIGYLVWLAEAPDEFKDKLRQYIRDPRIQREQEE